MSLEHEIKLRTSLALESKAKKLDNRFQSSEKDKTSNGGGRSVVGEMIERNTPTAVTPVGIQEFEIKSENISSNNYLE